jgi:serine/threonine protein kinase
MLNQFLSGRYKIVRALGEGGLAQTYIAEDHHKPSHPKCAVKFLKPASQEANFLPVARRLFNKEAEILEKLGEHSQIPRLLAYFEENQEFYLIQEFIDGYTLSTELPLGHRWSESKVISMLDDVLQILEFVHSYGVIHRDIKPNNLIRRKQDGRLVLIDFGAVKEVSNLRIMSNVPTSKKTISIGTQGYMPTEQVRGKPRLNSDIYALGMVGIQALTGVDPIYLEEDAEGEVIWRDRAKVSDLLADILTNMVRYHFKDRYQSATEVLEALRSLTNKQISTQPVFVSTKKEVNSELASDVEFRKTKVVLQPESKISQVFSERELQETKVALNNKPAKIEAVAQSDDRETKVVLQPESKISQVSSERELQETKVLKDNNSWISWHKKTVTKKGPAPKIILDNQKITQNLVYKPEVQPQETKLSLTTEKANEKVREKATTQPLQAVTKISGDAQEYKTTTLGLASDHKKKINLVDLITLFKFKVSQNLNINFAPTLATPKKSYLVMGTGIISIIAGLLASYNYFNYRKAYLQAEAKLKQIEELKVAEKYAECIQQSKIFPQDYTDLNSQLNTLLLDCRQGEATAKLETAKKLAAQSKYQDAIALLAQIPQDMTAYAEAQPLIKQWSNSIWQIATNQYREGKLESAKAIALAIPNNSPLITTVQATIPQWEQEWQQNQTYLETAQKGIQESRWQDAIKAAKKISDRPYWQKQSQPIIQKAEKEIAAAAKKVNNSSPKTVDRPKVTSYPSQTNKTYPKPISRSLPLLPLPSPHNSQPTAPASEPPSEWICMNNPNPKCKR